MAINQNHQFEDLDGQKCAVVEKNVTQERAEFLRGVLEFNGYTVIKVESPPPKTAPMPTAEGDEQVKGHDRPFTYTLGVTDVVFNATNAIFGRLLRTRDGRIVTQAYWQQKDPISEDNIPYYEMKNKIEPRI